MIGMGLGTNHYFSRGGGGGMRNLQAQTISFSATSAQTIFFQATVLQTIFLLRNAMLYYEEFKVTTVFISVTT